MSTATDTAERLAAEFPANTHAEWKEAAESLLKGKPFDKTLLTKTPENITLQPIYEREVLDTLPAAATLPGQDGYLRGTSATGSRLESWDIAQEVRIADPVAFNDALRRDLEVGQNAVSLDLTAPGALRLETAGDICAAFKGVVPTAIAWHFHAGLKTLRVAQLFSAWLAIEKVPAAQVRGSFNSDPIGVLAANASLDTPLDAALRDLASVVRYTKTFFPKFTAVGVSGRPYGDAGASAVEELGIMLATGLEYLRSLDAQGIAINDAAPQIAFHFSIGGNFFIELAKLRAARTLWARIVKELGGDAAAQAMRQHARTGIFNKTRHDPYVNILRTTTEALSGVLGGVDSLTVGTFDEVQRTPDAASRRIARNTHIILREECDISAVIDPAGGSWYIEKLTDEIAAGAWAFFQKVEEKGGASAALKSGFVQDTITATRKGREKLFAQRRISLVGTNQYPNIAEKPLPGATAVVAASAAAAPAAAAVTIKPLPGERLAVRYEALRAAAAAFKEKNGHGPKIHLANINALRRHKARADFTRGFFETGGFEITGAEGSTDAAVIAEKAVASGARLIVICGHDEDYVTFVPEIARAIKAKAPELTVILAGDPGEQAAAYTAAGLDTFISIKSDNYETNLLFLQKAGALAA